MPRLNNSCERPILQTVHMGSRCVNASMNSQSIPAVAAGALSTGKHLTFSVGGEIYGISVLRVREIIRHTPVTAVPQLATCIKGVIDLRGKVIPIVDLRIKFQLNNAEVTERTCVIVADVALSSGIRGNMGFIVDSVESVTHFDGSDIEPPPDFGTRIDSAHIVGMAKQEDRVVTLLNLDLVVVGDRNFE